MIDSKIDHSMIESRQGEVLTATGQSVKGTCKLYILFAIL